MGKYDTVLLKSQKTFMIACVVTQKAKIFRVWLVDGDRIDIYEVEISYKLPSLRHDDPVFRCHREIPKSLFHQVFTPPPSFPALYHFFLFPAAIDRDENGDTSTIVEIADK